MVESGPTAPSATAAANLSSAIQPPPLPANWRRRQNRPPGPGLFEALLWVLGMALAQIMAMMATIGILLVALVLPGGGLETTELARTLQNPKFLAELEESLSVPVFAGSQVIFAAFVLLGARLRLGRQMRRLLGTDSLWPGHAVLIVLSVLPISILSTKTYIWFTLSVWEPLKARYDWLSGLDGLSSMTMLGEIVQTTPVWVLLLAVAVVPAIAEELVFRGVIGRGLLARWGLPAGVLITSLMFAAMHLHPAHVVGVIPVGIAMHFVYIATRSFWAPMLLHFLNNTMAVFSAKLLHQATSATDAAAADVGMQIGLTPIELSAGWVLASVSCAAAIGLQSVANARAIHPPGRSALVTRLPHARSPAGRRRRAAGHDRQRRLDLRPGRRQRPGLRHRLLPGRRRRVRRRPPGFVSGADSGAIPEASNACKAAVVSIRAPAWGAM